MKLTTDAINRLSTLIQTSMVAGLKKMIIEPGKIRGIDEKQSVVVITTDNVPDLSGKSIGITRIEQLSARLALVGSQGDVAIEATETPSNDISILDLSSGKTKAQFRCATVEAVKGIPKNITDVLVWEVAVNSKLLPTLTQAVSAMSAETITIASRDGASVSFECIDLNKDVFTTDAEDGPQWIGSGTPSTSFVNKYPAKTLLGLLKEASKSTDPVIIKIGQGGILSLKVNSFDFFVLPSQ